MAALARGYEGLLVPSAALPGLNLVIVLRNVPEPSRLRVVRSTALLLERITQEQREEASGEDRR